MVLCYIYNLFVACLIILPLQRCRRVANFFLISPYLVTFRTMKSVLLAYYLTYTCWNFSFDVRSNLLYTDIGIGSLVG